MKIYDISRRYCKIVVSVCRFVGMLVTGYVNMLRSKHLRRFSVWGCHSTASPFLLPSFWKCFLNKISVCCFVFVLLQND